MKIDASFTFSPGNVILLKYLLRKLEGKNIEVELYLGHQKVFDEIKSMKLNQKFKIYKTSNLSTFKRLFQSNTNVLFFCSLPPFVKNIKSMVYFHSSYIARPVDWKDNNISLKTKCKRWISTKIIKFGHQNVDFFACQTQTMEKDLFQNYQGIKLKKIPFYDTTDLIPNIHQGVENFEYDFFYPATADVHKNHLLFFESVHKIASQRNVKVCVTIPQHAPAKYLEAIEKINQQVGYDAISNVGRVPKSEVVKLFQKSKALFFPSLEESFGLPIVEAAWMGVPILIADLPYAYDIVEHAVYFNPLDTQDMASKMKDFLDGKYQFDKQKPVIENKIDEIMKFFSHSNQRS